MPWYLGGGGLLLGGFVGFLVRGWNGPITRGVNGDGRNFNGDGKSSFGPEYGVNGDGIVGPDQTADKSKKIVSGAGGEIAASDSFRKVWDADLGDGSVKPSSSADTHIDWGDGRSMGDGSVHPDSSQKGFADGSVRPQDMLGHFKQDPNLFGDEANKLGDIK